MEVQLRELIDRIKSDGIKSAENSASLLLSEAETKAKSLLQEAEQEARGLREAARADAEKTRQAGEEALRQAGRNLVLEVRSRIEEMFTRLLKTETAGALKGDTLGKILAAAIEGVGQGRGSDLKVLLPEARLKDLEKELQTKFAQQIAAGLEFQPFKDIDAGFRLSFKDGSAFFDFSDTELADMLARYLNPKLIEILKK